MSSQLSIASVCRALPTPDDASGGIFVLRRLAAMSKIADVTTIQPNPYFPMVTPLPDWARAPRRKFDDVSIEHTPMFYVPKFFKSMDGFWLYRSVFAKLKELQNARGVDLVDAHFGYPEGVGAYRAARKLGIPVFVTLRGFEAEYVLKPFIGRQIRHTLRNADGCICVSHFLQRLAIEHGAPPEKTTVIQNAIDASLFYPGDQSAERENLGLPKVAPIFVSVGHLISRKRHHVSISAFASVLDECPDARLLIIGGTSFEPDYPGQLHALSEKLGVSESVSFLGNVDVQRVASYLRAADVFVLGTQREGCCNAILEALACGLPVVTTDVGDNTHFVNDGGNGYIVAVDDHTAMADAMRQAIERKDWSRDQIASSLQVGSWGDVAENVLGFFSKRTGKLQEFSEAHRR